MVSNRRVSGEFVLCMSVFSLYWIIAFCVIIWLHDLEEKHGGGGGGG